MEDKGIRRAQKYEYKFDPDIMALRIKYAVGSNRTFCVLGRENPYVLYSFQAQYLERILKDMNIPTGIYGVIFEYMMRLYKAYKHNDKEKVQYLCDYLLEREFDPTRLEMIKEAIQTALEIEGEHRIWKKILEKRDWNMFRRVGIKPYHSPISDIYRGFGLGCNFTQMSANYLHTLPLGELKEKWSIPVGYQNHIGVIGDINHDWKGEIAGGSYLNGITTLAVLNAEGEPIDIAQYSGNAYIVGADDVNGDGEVEFMILQYPTIFLITDIHFNTIKTINIGGLPTAFAWRDLNGDGKLEFIFGRYTGTNGDIRIIDYDENLIAFYTLPKGIANSLIAIYKNRFYFHIPTVLGNEIVRTMGLTLIGNTLQPHFLYPPWEYDPERDFAVAHPQVFLTPFHRDEVLVMESENATSLWWKGLEKPIRIFNSRYLDTLTTSVDWFRMGYPDIFSTGEEPLPNEWREWAVCIWRGGGERWRTEIHPRERIPVFNYCVDINGDRCVEALSFWFCGQIFAFDIEGNLVQTFDVNEYIERSAIINEAPAIFDCDMDGYAELYLFTHHPEIGNRLRCFAKPKE